MDCGLFHTFNADEQRRYVASLAKIAAAGGSLYVLCFSDEGNDVGPHPVARGELSAAFSCGNGWEVANIEPARVRTRYHGEDGAPAWLGTITRIVRGQF